MIEFLLLEKKESAYGKALEIAELAMKKCNMRSLCEEYINLLSSDIKASERFWELENTIKADRKKTGVIATMSRSKMVFSIADLVYDGAISMADIEEFSDDVKESVRMLLRMEE